MVSMDSTLIVDGIPLPSVMSKEMNGPHLPNRADIEVPLLRLLVELGGSLNFSHRGRELEVRLAEKFGLSDEDRDFAAPNYNSMGNRKWRNHLQFVRDRLVKSGELDNSVRNHWTVTDVGYRRLGIVKKV